MSQLRTRERADHAGDAEEQRGFHVHVSAARPEDAGHQGRPANHGKRHPDRLRSGHLRGVNQHWQGDD